MCFRVERREAYTRRRNEEALQRFWDEKIKFLEKLADIEK